MDLTTDEIRIIETLITQNDSADVLGAQIQLANAIRREWTGFGFLTHLSIPDPTPRLPISKRIVMGGSGRMSGRACTFLLFTTDDGRLDFLEGATFGDEPLPEAAVLEEVRAD